MTAFSLTPSQREYAAGVRRIAAEAIVPLLAELGKQGLLRGLFGGRPDEPVRDAAAMQLCLLRESLAQVSGEVETALALQGLGSYPILQAGSPAQVDRWLPGVVAG